MGLRDRAALDFQRFANRKTGGFGYDIVITAPGGQQQALVGFSNDISATIDPDTGQLISGRVASVSVSLLDLDGFTIPANIVEEVGKPWLVEFDGIAGEAYTFKVRESIPDRSIGSIVLMLETFGA